jgi:DNA-binding response OmpR family regulator
MAATRERRVVRAAGLEIRPTEGLVVAGDRVVPMSPRELAVLDALARREGRTVSRAELYELVWGAELRAGDRSIDVYVHKVRTKLEEAVPERSFIHTHVGFGYRFTPLSHDFHNRATAT